MSESEDKANWRQFFEHVMDEGLKADQLQLVVGDGRKGLQSAAQGVFPPSVRYQRCISA
jgi:transposase-like protein